MKRRVVVVIFLMAFVWVSAFASSTNVGDLSLSDLSALTDEQLLSVNSAVMSELSSRKVSAFTAKSGVYTVGVDFPAGRYAIACASNSEWIVVTIYDENGKHVFSHIHYLESENSLGSIDVLESYTVKVEHGSARFSQPEGIVFE